MARRAPRALGRRVPEGAEVTLRVGAELAVVGEPVAPVEAGAPFLPRSAFVFRVCTTNVTKGKKSPQPVKGAAAGADKKGK